MILVIVESILSLFILFGGTPLTLVSSFTISSTRLLQRKNDIATSQQYHNNDRLLRLQRPHVPCNFAYSSSSHSVVVLHMAWGPEPIWSTATVASITDACPSGKSITLRLNVPAETAAEYRIPGQYVQVTKPNSADTKPAFLAICSPPLSDDAADKENSGTPYFDFLIKKTENNEWLTTNVAPGTALQVSQVLGKGYATAENLDSLKYDFPTQSILLFATGSGIAPIVAAIESQTLVSPTNQRTCRLYYGEQTAADLCFVERFAMWEDLGVQVVPVLSQPEKSTTDPVWQGRTGYVQTALAEDGIAIPRNTGALLCGMKGMTEAVKEMLLASGVFEGRVLFNF